MDPLPTSSYHCKNLRSALDNAEDVTRLLQQELEKGYVFGPFEEPPFDTYRISPLGIAESKYSHKKRLIVDLSAPHDNGVHSSLNDLIDKDDFSLSYVKIDDAIKIINSLGSKAWLCKTDIVDAFKLMPIHPSLWHLYGVQWDSKFYFFQRLAFGSRSSPRIFDTLSQAVCWIATNNYGLDPILHLLDDFLTIDHPDHDGERFMALLTLVFNVLNIPISPPKTVGPEHVLEYLGIILDTVRMEARLPPDKLARITDLLQRFMQRRTCTKREALSLLGHLSYAGRVIVPGRTFISRLIEASKSVQALHHHIYLSAELKEEISMWFSFLRDWNGVSFFLENDVTPANDMALYTDASSTIGYGAFFQGEWFQGRWPQDLATLVEDKLSMAYMELYPIVVAACLWGHKWSRKRILFHCDNMGTVHILHKGRSRAPAIMRLMRRLVLLAAQHNFAFTATFLPGRNNCIADALSRFQMERFWAMVPDANPVPCQLPCNPMYT